MMRRTMLMVVAISLVFLQINAVLAATLNGKAEIVDGDTIKVGGLPVRLYGIDAPEGRQTCEQAAKRCFRGLIDPKNGVTRQNSQKTAV